MENSLSAKSGADDIRRRKLGLVLAILRAGMIVALAWAGMQGWWLGHGYPYNTFLFDPRARFNDFSDMIIDAGRENPYQDPAGIYLPFAWVFFRVFGAMPYDLALTLFLFVASGGLFMLLVAALAGTVRPAWKRVALALALLALSYPVICVVDRANLEIYLACLVAAALYFFARQRYGLGTLCLILSASFKLYPFVFLLLLLRQRRMKWILLGLLGFVAAFFLSFGVLGLPVETGVEFYGRDLVFLTRTYVLENYALEGCASIWNVYKIALITASNFGLMAPVDFSYDGNFIRNSYAVYSTLTALAGLALAFHVCFVEKEFLRCAIALLLYLSVSTPMGADYRLLHAGIALVVLILLRTRRPYDLVILVLLALAMVPKKEIFLAYAGKTETNFADVSIQVVLNPLLVATALAFLVCDGFRLFDSRWAWLRGRRMMRSLLPRRQRKRMETALPEPVA
jgi:hypothetical protein